jgi:hypothetical protein
MDGAEDVRMEKRRSRICKLVLILVTTDVTKRKILVSQGSIILGAHSLYTVLLGVETVVLLSVQAIT